MAQDYYEVLGVAPDATPQEIKRAFRQIARECHPDVAGDDPEAAARFKTARKAYETLMDPVTRARYDRRGQRRFSGGGNFFDAFYNHVSGNFGEEATHKQQSGPKAPQAHGPSGPTKPGGQGAHEAGGHASSERAQGAAGNDLDLDDLFKDFGDFGFGSNKRRRGRAPGRDPSARRNQPTPGDDVHIELDVPARIAAEGGTVTAVYYRMQRSDSWRPGSQDPGVVRIQDIADVRIMPGTRDGEVLRERGLGDAGAHGGPYGSLVVRVRVVGRPDQADRPATGEVPREQVQTETAPPPRPPRRPPPPVAEAQASGPDGMVIDISLVEALLGGRVALKTPQGKVRITIPAGTSGGTRMRLKGKGDDGEDLFVSVRIRVPKQLDDESRELIERFAELNPDD